MAFNKFTFTKKTLKEVLFSNLKIALTLSKYIFYIHFLVFKIFFLEFCHHKVAKTVVMFVIDGKDG